MTTHTHVLGGDVTSALSHLMVVGLASILEETGDQEVFFGWEEHASARPVLWGDLDGQEVGERVRSHAERHSGGSSWLSSRVETGVREGSALFSPRVKVPKGEAARPEWQAYEDQRRDTLDRLGPDLTDLDHRMLLALGEPAWWQCDGKDDQPDKGASRWEMKTRNRGEEFIRHRLSPLAGALARRTADGVWSGLTGRTVVDETGSGEQSRTPTGLTLPKAADSAQAWCALWGISALPTIARSTPAGVNGYSQSAGAWPRTRARPQRMVLPAFTCRTILPHYRAICASAQLDVLASDAGTPFERETARVWLRGQGVRATIAFGVHEAGSPSAPERQLMSGRIDTL